MLREPYFTTEYGKAFLGDSLELMAELLDESINLVVTSPPFALTRKKAYGNKEDHEYVEWFMPFAKEIRRILREDGSFVLDLGGAYHKGTPTRSLYQYELLIKLCNEGGIPSGSRIIPLQPDTVANACRMGHGQTGPVERFGECRLVVKQIAQSQK